MWFGKNRPSPEEVAPRTDTHEAQQALAQAESGLIKVQEQESLVERISAIMINRHGNNHYMELLYEHIPGSAH